MNNYVSYHTSLSRDVKKKAPLGYFQDAQKSARFLTGASAENCAGENCAGNLRRLVDYFAAK